MTVRSSVASKLGRWTPGFGAVERRLRCCDTELRIQATGLRSRAAVERGRRTALELEKQLDSFAEDSAVSRLNREGEVENPHVAELVRRAEEYRRRTGGAFDVRYGELESEVKSYIRGDTDSVSGPDATGPSEVSVEGDRVVADGRVDLNGLAKGYVVDAVVNAVEGSGRGVFVDGGGDISPPPGVVSVDSPYGDGAVELLETGRYVATSGGYRRHRGDVDHVYDPRGPRTGARHDSVTVVVERDCVEADALATAASALPREEALELVEDWSGADALFVDDGEPYTTKGFEEHVYQEGVDG